MAITRTQIAKQLLANGGRIGFKGGADMGTVEDSKGKRSATRADVSSTGAVTTSAPRGPTPGPDDRSTEQQNINQLRSQNRFVAEDEDLLPGDIPDERVDIPLTNRERDLYENRDLFINDTSGRTLPGILGKIISLNRKPNRTFFYERVLKNNAQGLNYTQLQDAYDKYMKGRMSGETDAMGNPINQGNNDTSDIPLIPFGNQTQPGTEPETETEPDPFQTNFRLMADGGMTNDAPGEGIMQMASAPDPMDERNMVMETIAMEEFGKPLSDLTDDEIIQIEIFMDEMSKIKNEPRIMAQQGGRMMMDDDPTGGIMDLESGRQQYFLGKLVKKATRAVKKIAKSPIGKAALMYFGGQALGGKGLSSFFGKGSFNPFKFAIGAQPGMDGANPGGFGLSGLGKIAKSLGLVGTEGALTGMGKIAIPTIASYLMTPEEEEQQAMNYGADIDDPEYIMNNPDKYTNRRLVADGGIMRLNYAEGSKEPVAKKTMPLLDMDGQEMDLREEGGFVPLGRMERADDVPARLSKNEFVFTADAVRNAGEGDIDKGAEVMYNMMKNLESGGEVSEESQGLEGAREMFQTSQRLEEVI